MTEAVNEFNSKTYLGQAKDKLDGLTGNEQIVLIPLSKVRGNPNQPRRYFDKTKLEELANSIKETGVLEPILVKRIEDIDSEFLYEIIAGERRFRASLLAEKDNIPCIVRQFDDIKTKTIALVENVQREDLNFVDTMNAYAGLRELYGNSEDISKQTGKTVRTINRYLKAYNDINLIKEIADLVNLHSSDIEQKSADILAGAMAGIKKLQKANKREYDRVIKRLSEKGLIKNLDWLGNKFNDKQIIQEQGIKNNELFKETDTEYSLHIKVKKSSPLPIETMDLIKKDIALFLEKITSIPEVPTQD